jgi:hypothetical protein
MLPNIFGQRGTGSAFDTPGRTLQSPVSAAFGYGNALQDQVSDEEKKRRAAQTQTDQGVAPVSSMMGYGG